MYHDEHFPPHFHAVYGEHKASLEIESLRVIKGRLPGRVLGLVLEWASLHRDELEANWRALRSGGQVDKIAPLT